MPPRPTWSGSLQISLVSIGVKIFPASNTGNQVEFHQIDKKTHQRVHHQKVDNRGEVEKADVVKGYEYAKNRYVEIDPDELKALRLPTTTTMQIKQFVKVDTLPPSLFDRPYFVAPKEDSQNKALSIMRRALRNTNTYGIGEIAFSGREHLVAIAAPLDPKQKGLMLAKQFGPKGIRVNGVAPGPIWTPLQVSGGATQEHLIHFGETYPLRRAGQPAELASIYVQLAANDASYTTGNIYGAGGGGGQP